MDIFNNTVPVQLLAAQSINDTDTVSSILDTQGFDGSAIYVAMGNLTGVDADSTLALNLQESADTVGSNFTAVAVLDMIRDTTGLDSTSTAGRFGFLNATDEDVKVFKVEYKGTERYIRVQLDFTTGTGGITAAPVCVLGILASARHAPASAPAAITAS